MKEIGAIFAKNIKEARDVKNMSQQDFSEFLGIGLRTYQRYEAGNAPTKSARRKIARVLGVDEADLFREKIANNNNDSIVTINDSVRILDKISKLNDKNRELVLKSIDTLLETQERVKNKKVNS